MSATGSSALQPMAAGKQPSHHRKRGRHHGHDDDDGDVAPRSPPNLTSETGRIWFDFAAVSLGSGGFSIEIFPLTVNGGHGGGGRSGGRAIRHRARPIERRWRTGGSGSCVHAARPCGGARRRRLAALTGRVGRPAASCRRRPGPRHWWRWWWQTVCPTDRPTDGRTDGGLCASAAVGGLLSPAPHRTRAGPARPSVGR